MLKDREILKRRRNLLTLIRNERNMASGLTVEVKPKRSPKLVKSEKAAVTNKTHVICID